MSSKREEGHLSELETRFIADVLDVASTDVEHARVQLEDVSACDIGASLMKPSIYPLIVSTLVGWGYRVPHHYAWWVVTIYPGAKGERVEKVESSGDGRAKAFLNGRGAALNGPPHTATTRRA